MGFEISSKSGMRQLIRSKDDMYCSRLFSAPQFDMDLRTAINTFDRIIGPLGEVELYTRGRVDAEGCLIDPACWMTDQGLAIYFTRLPPNENPDQCDHGPQPADYSTEDELVIVTFAEAIRICWLYQSLFLLQTRTDCIVIWDAQRLEQQFNAIMHMRRGWAPIHENEIYLHQNAVELSLVNACIAFKRLAMEEGFYNE